MSVLSSEDRAFWEENGYVVIHDAAPPELIQNTAKAVWGPSSKWMPTTLIVGTPDPPRKGIMVEIYQHPALWATRQHPRIHQAFAEIWDNEKLWVSFDRASMSPPNVSR